MGKIIKDGLAGKKASSGIECCVSKIEKFAALAKVAILQSANFGLVTKEHLSIV